MFGEQEAFDERQRLVVLGSSRVGKTSLIRRFLYNDFPERYIETVEDLHSRDYRLAGRCLAVDVLDTNHQFPDMRKLAIIQGHAFLLVFAVDDVVSFREMSELWEELRKRRSDICRLPVVIVGNKCDSATKKILPEMVQAFVRRLEAKSDLRYVEASAKTGRRVADVFQALLELSDFTAGCRRRLSVRGAEPTTGPPVVRNDEPAATRTNIEHGCSLAPPAVATWRNRSLRLRRSKSPRRQPPQAPQSQRNRSPSPAEGKLARHGSLVRRTKHMSLRKKHTYADLDDLNAAGDDPNCVVS